MVEVTIDSIRVSLMTQHRVVVLKETDSDRYLPIWIGPFEADAITIQLQGVQVPRPLTHDLLKSFIREMGVRVSHVLVSELRNDTFFARIVVDVNGKSMEIDSRPSDAIALAVRVGAPIFVSEEVMGMAAIIPEEDISTEAASPEEEEGLDAFRDFVESLDLDDLTD
jgi:bifunctional DNase/RNase